LVRALFKILRAELRPRLHAKPRYRTDRAADDRDRDKTDFKRGSHITSHENSTAVPISILAAQTIP
jgi:hypothetical protein